MGLIQKVLKVTIRRHNVNKKIFYFQTDVSLFVKSVHSIDNIVPNTLQNE